MLLNSHLLSKDHNNNSSNYRQIRQKSRQVRNFIHNKTIIITSTSTATAGITWILSSDPPILARNQRREGKIPGFETVIGEIGEWSQIAGFQWRWNGRASKRRERKIHWKNSEPGEEQRFCAWNVRERVGSGAIDLTEIITTIFRKVSRWAQTFFCDDLIFTFVKTTSHLHLLKMWKRESKELKKE